jgi:hypothetical protein
MPMKMLALGPELQREYCQLLFNHCISFITACLDYGQPLIVQVRLLYGTS